MNELIKISYENAEHPTVSGRELHKALEVETRYNDCSKECVNTVFRIMRTFTQF